MATIVNREVIVSSQEKAEASTQPEFVPKGAVAFFAGLIIGFAIIWGGVYMLMVHRQFHP
jgi:hypothetical protein